MNTKVYTYVIKFDSSHIHFKFEFPKVYDLLNRTFNFTITNLFINDKNERFFGVKAMDHEKYDFGIENWLYDDAVIFVDSNNKCWPSQLTLKRNCDGFDFIFPTKIKGHMVIKSDLPFAHFIQ